MLETLSKMGNSALNIVQTVSWISSLLPGSWLRNWLQGNANISNPVKAILAIKLIIKMSHFLKKTNTEESNKLVTPLTLVFVFFVQDIQFFVVLMCQSTASIRRYIKKLTEIRTLVKGYMRWELRLKDKTEFSKCWVCDNWYSFVNSIWTQKWKIHFIE